MTCLAKRAACAPAPKIPILRGLDNLKLFTELFVFEIFFKYFF